MGLTFVNIPKSVTSIGGGAFYCENLETVVSYIEDPFAIDGASDNVYDLGWPFSIPDTFSKNTFYNATLYVPAGTAEKYKATKGWKDFVHIEEFDHTSIEQQESDSSNDEVGYYSLDGKSHRSQQRGLNIVRMKDGTVKKILVK